MYASYRINIEWIRVRYQNARRSDRLAPGRLPLLSAMDGMVSISVGARLTALHAS